MIFDMKNKCSVHTNQEEEKSWVSVQWYMALFGQQYATESKE